MDTQIVSIVSHLESASSTHEQTKDGGGRADCAIGAGYKQVHSAEASLLMLGLIVTVYIGLYIQRHGDRRFVTRRNPVESREISQMAEYVQTVREVQATNKFILRRLTQIQDQDTDVCTCDCHSKDESKDIKALKTKVECVEEENKQRDDTVDQIQRELGEIKEAFLHLRDNDSRLSDIRALDRTLESATSKGIQHLQLGTEGKYGVDYHYSKSDDDTKADKESADKLEPSKDRNTHKTNTDTHVTSTVPDQNKEKQETDHRLRPQENVQTEYHRTVGDVESDRGSVDKDTAADRVETAEKVADSEPVLVYNVQEERRDEMPGPKPSLAGSGSSAAEGTQTRNKNSDDTRSDARSNAEAVRDDQEHLPHVIRQKQKAYRPELAWEMLFSNEISEAKMMCGSLGGVHMVVCVDISESMAQDGAWGQAKRFFHDLMNGLIKMKHDEGITDEHVALVTFGHDTRVVRRLTNHFEEVRASFDRIKLGGPSPLFGGLKMAIAAAGSSEKQKCVVNGLKVDTKIVLVTDGRPTQNDLVEGPDETDYFKQDEVMAGSLQIMEDIAKYDLDFFCVPVGKADKEFLDLAVAIPKGRYLKFTDGHRFSRRTYLTLKAGSSGKGVMGMLESAGIREYMAKNMPELDMGQLNLESGQAALAMALGQQEGGALAHLSQDDQEQIKEIRERGHVSMDELLKRATSGDGGGGKYRESDSDVLPPLGTRVRRGPDWSWDNQDHEGPGTVIGHIPERKHLWVEWDADDHSYYYHYGGAGRYDILPVEEPRLPGDDGKLKVGCVVKPGKDWKDTRVQQFDRGVVIRLLTKADANVKVRWTNGTRGNYAHNYKGKTEVEFSAPHGDTRTTQQTPATFGTSRRKNKNKNKNA